MGSRRWARFGLCFWLLVTWPNLSRADSLYTVRVSNASGPVDGAEIQARGKVLGNTNRDGRFEEDGPSGRIELLVTKRCYRPAKIERHCSSGSICSFGRVELEPVRGAIHVSVTAAGVGPVEGADVVVDGKSLGATTARGRLDTAAPCGRTYKVSATKHGYTTARKSVEIVTGPVTVPLEIEQIVEELVVKSRGEGELPAITVTRGEERLKGTVIEDGAALRYAVPWGEYVVRATKEGYAPYELDLTVESPATVVVPNLVPTECADPGSARCWTALVSQGLSLLNFVLLIAGVVFVLRR